MSIQIVNFNQNSSSYELVDGELERLLLAENVKDREIVVISIAGAFRKGKSFLLNFFIRYLQDKFVKKNVAGNWLGNPNDRLDGFVWKGGSTRVTTGIHMWSEVFLHDFEDGRKVAIIVIDTQGTFDTKSTMKDCSTIFALSTLLSSVQILNLMQNIQEDDLQHLQLFSEYGRLVANEGDSPFQKLFFLVRDWSYHYENQFGAAGGQEKLNEVLEIHEGQDEELRSLRSHIKTCFSHVECFLMPHPGREVVSSPNFNGRLDQIEQEFRNSLLQLVPQLMSPENLVVKKIHGQSVTCADFVDYFKSYLNEFKKGKLPEVMTVFQATANVYNMKAVTEGNDYYTSNMSKFCSTWAQIKEDDLMQQHSKTKKEAIAIMTKRQLMGTEEFLKTFFEKLGNLIEANFIEYLETNREKRTISNIIFKVITTLAIAGGTVAGGMALSTPMIMELVPTLPTAGVTLISFLLKFIRLRP